jgi:hypothetical protein
MFAKFRDRFFPREEVKVQEPRRKYGSLLNDVFLEGVNWGYTSQLGDLIETCYYAGSNFNGDEKVLAAFKSGFQLGHRAHKEGKDVQVGNGHVVIGKMLPDGFSGQYRISFKKSVPLHPQGATILSANPNPRRYNDDWQLEPARQAH